MMTAVTRKTNHFFGRTTAAVLVSRETGKNIVTNDVELIGEEDMELGPRTLHYLVGKFYHLYVCREKKDNFLYQLVGI